MGPGTCRDEPMTGKVSVSALSDHLMGPERTLSNAVCLTVSVSALSDHLMGRDHSQNYKNNTVYKFQYPLFRII